MKKKYISPETIMIMMQQSSMICASVEGFKGGLNNDPVNQDKLLSRRGYDDWDDEDEEEDY
jgi:hypothetical protein